MKKMLSFLMIAMLLFGFAACGGDVTSSSVPPASSAAVSSQAPSSSSMPVVPEEPLNQAFLTGLERGPDYPEGKRITAVMVNNVATARPANGLSEAKMLVEIKVEGNITRFMAIYEDYETMPKVGGLRSARDQFFQLLLPFWGFYVHEGQSTPMNHFFADYEYQEFDIQSAYGSVYTKDPSRGTSTYSWFDVSAETITNHIKDRGLDDYRDYSSPMFNFVPYTQAAIVPAGGEAGELAVTHSSSYISYFTFNKSLQKYEMSQWNSYSGQMEKTIDNNNNQQLAFTNLLILFAPMTLYADSPLVKVDYSQGVGYYVSNGGYELLNWEKGGPNQALQLYKRDSGEPMQINCGNTYLAVVDDNLLPDFFDAMESGKFATSGATTGAETETED